MRMIDDGSFVPEKTTDAFSEIATVFNEGADAPDDISTPYSLSVGDSFVGSLDPSGERDWVAITLTAGQSVDIYLEGITLTDPLVRLYDSAGNLITSNDDTNGLDSFLNFTSASGGTYYIAAGSYNDSYGGSYQIAVVEPGETPPEPPTPPYDPLDTIDWGTTVADTNVTVYFGPNGFTADGVTSEGFNAYEIQQFELAFDLIEAVSGLTFTVVGTAAAADFDLVLDTDGELSGILGYFNPPGTSNAGVGAFNGASWDRTAGGDLDIGGFGFITIVHELLHGLGLAHPHDTGGTSILMPGVADPYSDTGFHLLNQGVFTMMSYVDGFVEGDVGTPASGPNFGYQATPMALDIALLQDKYGTNPTTNSGNTVYLLPSTNAPGTYWSAIWDTGGTDTIEHTGSTGAVIELRAATLQDEEGGGGFISAVDGIQGGFTIANGVVIENATGGSGGDLLIGNSIGNQLLGNDGADTIAGGDGDDSINGGAQNDILIGGEGNDEINGGLGADSILGGGGNDAIVGGNRGDTITGDAGNDTIGAGNGDDDVDGGDGDDLVRGGDADDIIQGGADNDTLLGGVGVDTINGGDGNDTIKGRGGFDLINGGAGDDKLFGGNQADQFIFEDGWGNDTIADFNATNDAEDIDLSAVTAITDFTDLVNNHMSQVGADVIIDDLLGNTIKLSNVNMSDLHNADFDF